MAGTEADAESSSNMSDINNSNAVAMLWEQPRDAEEFRTLCDALQRNDPNVTCISTNGLHMLEEGCGFKLGHALQRNTVVSSIILSLFYLVESREAIRRDRSEQHTSKLIAERMGLLLHWMEHSCSLRHVQIHSGWDDDLLLEPIMDALVKHQNLLCFEPHTCRVSLSLLTPVLQANTSLLVLKISVVACEMNDSDDIIDESARAVGALYQLEVLSLKTSQIDPFLRHLSNSPAFTTTLRELDLDFSETSMRFNLEAGMLCQLLSDRSCRLERLELRNVELQRRSWTLLSSALLRSNPSSSLRALVLYNVTFSEEAARLFLRDMQSNPNVPSMHQQDDREEQPDPPLHHIVDLRLTYCTFNTSTRAMEFGNMLCGSLLQNLTLDIDTLGRRRQAFFDVLTTRGTASCLQSLNISCADTNDLRRLAPYIATTLHLCCLTVQLSNDIFRDVSVPNVFLFSLRSNGSLHKVNVSGDRYTPSDARLLRFQRIQAYTTRNRVLPQLMVNTSFGSNANRRQGNDAAEQQPSEAASVAPSFASTPSASAFPTLGAVAEHAPRMAPNTLLKSFLAASESLLPERPLGNEA